MAGVVEATLPEVSVYLTRAGVYDSPLLQVFSCGNGC